MPTAAAKKHRDHRIEPLREVGFRELEPEYLTQGLKSHWFSPRGPQARSDVSFALASSFFEKKMCGSIEPFLVEPEYQRYPSGFHDRNE